MAYRVGVDLGGTKISAVVIAPDGSERARRRVATPRGDYPGTLAAIADLVAALEHEVGATVMVGVAMPGAVSPWTGLIKNANSTWLNGRPFVSDLAVQLGRPVRVENDANCLAVSEAADGVGAGAAVLFAAILGTGCGGGVVVGGRPLTGANAIAGEWGHNPLPWPTDTERPGPPCYCGRHGCLETFVSGPAIAADHARITGRHETVEAIAAAADAGDRAAIATLERFFDRLARGLATVVNLIDPDVIVLGGGVSNLAQLYDRVPALLPAHCFSDAIATPIRPARHGDDSGVRGAAWLWSVGEVFRGHPPQGGVGGSAPDNGRQAEIRRRF